MVFHSTLKGLNIQDFYYLMEHTILQLIKVSISVLRGLQVQIDFLQRVAYVVIVVTKSFRQSKFEFSDKQRFPHRFNFAFQEVKLRRQFRYFGHQANILQVYYKSIESLFKRYKLMEEKYIFYFTCFSLIFELVESTTSTNVMSVVTQNNSIS